VDEDLKIGGFHHNKVSIESIICNLGYFYKGAASFEWLELQPITKILRLQKEAEKINKQLENNV
jgi:hypothetical protein